VRHEDTLFSATVASWVQAVGSIGAILVAILVSRQQFSHARVQDEQRRQQELRAFVQAIHAELQTLWAGYSAKVGAHLSLVRDDGAFTGVWPATIEAFTIYNNNSAFVGKIEDAKLREMVVEGFARFKGVILSVGLNNRFIQEHSSAYSIADPLLRTTELLRTQDQLVGYLPQLKTADTELKAFIPGLITALKTYADNMPTSGQSRFFGWGRR